MVLPPIRFERFVETEDIEEYFKRLEMFLEVSGMKDDQKVACV